MSQFAVSCDAVTRLFELGVKISILAVGNYENLAWSYEFAPRKSRACGYSLADFESIQFIEDYASFSLAQVYLIGKIKNSFNFFPNGSWTDTNPKQGAVQISDIYTNGLYFFSESFLENC